MPTVSPLPAGRAPVRTATPIPAIARLNTAAPPPQAERVAKPDLAHLMDRTERLAELDYYELLELTKEATAKEIKLAFYRESRLYHPDRFFQAADPVLRERVNELYKRVTEAYSVLKDDLKRRKYTQDISGPERAQKLRYTEQSETETKLAQKREQEEQIGTHPKGRSLYQTGLADLEAQRFAQAERNFKMAVTYEPQNPRYKERLAEAQAKLAENARDSGHAFKIK